MATTNLLSNATRTNTTITSPDIATPLGLVAATFTIVGTNWTDPGSNIRLEIEEAADGVTFELSARADFPVSYTPRPGRSADRTLTFTPGYRPEQFPLARLRGRCIVSGTVRFRLDVTTVP